jgi:hypothetical protein
MSFSVWSAYGDLHSRRRVSEGVLLQNSDNSSQGFDEVPAPQFDKQATRQDKL